MSMTSADKQPMTTRSAGPIQPRLNARLRKKIAPIRMARPPVQASPRPLTSSSKLIGVDGGFGGVGGGDSLKMGAAGTLVVKLGIELARDSGSIGVATLSTGGGAIEGSTWGGVSTDASPAAASVGGDWIDSSVCHEAWPLRSSSRSSRASIRASVAIRSASAVDGRVRAVIDL